MPEWKETRMGKDHCPKCSALLDTASDPNGLLVPKPGDLCVCIKCATVLRYADDMALEHLPKGAMLALPPNVLRDIERYVIAVRAMHRSKRATP